IERVPAVLDTRILGEQVLTYTCTNAIGEADTKTRTVDVRDTVPPAIQLHGRERVSVIQDAKYRDAGATCTDLQAGTFMVNASTDTSVPGAREITLTCRDQSGNSANATRTVIVVPAGDKTEPVITLVGPDRDSVRIGATYDDPGATCRDPLEGLLDVTSSGLGDLRSGVHLINYTCVDIVGNTDKRTRTVVPVEPDDTLTLVLRGTTIHHLNVGDTYEDPGASCTDELGREYDWEARGDDLVDTVTPAEFPVVYTCNDGARSAEPVVRTVRVVAQFTDTDPPTITVKNATIDLRVNSPYTDIPVTCEDVQSGGISLVTSVITSGGRVVQSVAVSEPGSSTITYDCTDQAGNRASEGGTYARIVNVHGMPELEWTGRPDPDVPSAFHPRDLPFDMSELAGCKGDVGTFSYFPEPWAGNDGDPRVTIKCSTPLDSDTLEYVVRMRLDTIDPPVLEGRSIQEGFISAPSPVLPGTDLRALRATCHDDVTGTDVQGVQSMPPDTSVDPIKLTFTCTGPVHNNTNEDSIYVREREPDLVPPVILDVDGTEGLAPAVIRQGVPYEYMEPTCTDDAHPSLPVTRTTSVDTSVVGVQQVTYECTDFSLNTATAQRQVTVIHNHDPFVMLEPPVVVHQDDTPFQYDGASCIDDSEDLVPVQSGDEVTGFVEGLFRITYTCTDSAGNSGSSVLPVLVNRTVTAQYENVRLETGPKSVIYVAQDASSPDVHGSLVMANVTCTADPFGQTPLDVSFEVEYVQPGGNSFDREQVLLTDLGIHHVYYECLGMNDQRDIHVMDRPSIDYGIDADVAVIEVDGDFEDRAVCSNWASSLPLSGEEARAPGSHTFLEGSLVLFERTGMIDNSAAGILSKLTYTCTDRIGQTLTDSRDVLVRDADPPEIIIGEPELLHPLNEAFNHTRICRDMAEGDKPASYVPESGIDVTLLAEEQELTYYCEDSAGNEAINKTLSVVIVEGDSALHLEMHGHSVTYHETDPAYEDPGAVCLSTNLGLRTI
ncbi:MAG: DUF5011 domain-containing protein, partial [Nitrosopumilus sp.]|nr:DUF5011 domain-containing protein [Nitrosopumilus sp.]